MRFPPSFLDDIRGRVTLSSVVGRKVAWDRRKTHAGKGDYWACCPFHGEKSASFHVDDRKGRYHCFGCKASGDVFTFLVEKEGLSFPEAVERLAAEAGLPMPAISEVDQRREAERASLHDVMEIAARFFEAELQSARGAAARSYLAGRHLEPAIQREFRLGFAPDERSALRNHLARHNVTPEQMVEAGLIIRGEGASYDRFRGRIMFPIRDARGRVIAFGGRALAKEVPAKYLNSPETPLFHKGRVLYNIDKARGPAHERGAIIVVEGYVDVIAMHRAGLPHAVAPLGTALTEDQLALLWKIAPEPVLCFDGDTAGLKAAHRALDLALPLLKPGHSLRLAFLPQGQDPDDLLAAQGPDALHAVIAAAQPLSEVLWQRALAENDRATPERRAMFERDLRNLVNGISDDVVRRHYVAEMGRRIAELFRPAGAARRRHAPGGHHQRMAGRGWKSGPRPWAEQVPASPDLKRLASETVSERRERLIVLTVINHPDLLHEFVEELMQLEMSNRELHSILAQLIDHAAAMADLDRAGIRGHLMATGFGPVLDRLERQARRLNEWFLGSGAAKDDARTGLRQMIALHRKTVTLARELKAAEAAFAADPTEKNLNALNAVREQMMAHAGSEARIEGFGAASGRSADVIG